MATKNKIQIIIDANGTRARKAFNAVKGAVGGLAKKILSLNAGLAVAAGAVGLGLIVKSSLNAIDKIGKLSKTYGIATKELAAFKLAAELGGTSLNTFAKGAKTLGKNVNEFVTKGSGEAADSFKQLGISAEDLRPIMNDSVAQLGLVADKLNEMPDGATKTALAMELLGGRAIELLPALAGGTKQFELYRKEAKLFGLALSKDAVKGVENANDAMTRLSALMTGFRDQTVASLAPALESMVNSIKDKLLDIAQGEGGVEAFAKKIAKSIINGFRAATIGSVKALEGIKIAVNFAVSALQGLTDAVGVLAVINEMLTFGDVSKVWSERAQRIAAFSVSLDKLKISTGNTTESIARINAVADGFIATIDTASTSTDEHKKKQKELKPEIEKTTDALDEQADTQKKDLIPANDALIGSLGDVANEYKALGNEAEDAGKKIGLATAQSSKATALRSARAEAEAEVFINPYFGQNEKSKQQRIDRLTRRALKDQGFATGGRILPSGAGTKDSRVVELFTRPDEEILIRTPEQKRQDVGNTAQGGNIININMYNVHNVPQLARELQEWQRTNGPITNTLNGAGG